MRNLKKRMISLILVLTLTFVRQVVEQVMSFQCLFALLFVPEDQIDPMMQILRNIIRFYYK